MNAILLTIFVGFVLVGFFVLLFVVHRRDAESSSAERDSLMPLEEEMTRVVGRPRTPPAPDPIESRNSLPLLEGRAPARPRTTGTSSLQSCGDGL